MTPVAKDLGELYLGDFDGFVARRDALAKRLRADGDGEGADEVKALKKPNRVVWALNQLGAKESKRLLKAGAALRGAQQKVVAGDADSDDLRAASDAEREAVNTAMGAVKADLNASAAEKARQTLHAVALDEEVRDQFERRRLTSEHDAPGLGDLMAAGAAAKPKAKARAKESKDAKRKRVSLKKAEDEARKAEIRREDAERGAEEARKTAEQAQRVLDRATKELERASEAADAASTRLEDLR